MTSSDGDLIEHLGKLRPIHDKTRWKEWRGSPWEWVLPQPTATKGKIGESLFKGVAQRAGFEVEKVPDDDADWLVEGVRVEVKFSTYSGRSYRWLQIRPGDNYAVVALFGVRPGRSHLWIESKEAVVARSKAGHGGEEKARAKDEPPDTMHLTLHPYRLPDWIRRESGSLDSAMEDLGTFCSDLTPTDRATTGWLFPDD